MAVVGTVHVLGRRAIWGAHPLAPTATAIEETFAMVSRFAGGAQVRTMRKLLAMNAIPPNLRMAQINTAAFHSAWFGDFAPTEPDLIVVFYVHGRWAAAGGAYVAGNAYIDAEALAVLMEEVRGRHRKVAVMSIEYSLAPEYPYPRAMKEVLAAYEHLTEELHVPPSRVVFAGTSAGGGLIAGALLLLRDAQKVLPAAAILISPWVDLHMTTRAYQHYASVDMLNREGLVHARDLYLQGRPLDTINCPVLADLSRLPPALVFAGEVELFVDDIRAYVAAYERANGVDHCLLHVEPAGLHANAVLAVNPARVRAQMQHAAAFLVARVATS